MKQLRIILQSNLFYIISIILILVYLFINLLLIDRKSIYNENQKEFYGTVIKINKTDYGYSFILKSKEKLICYSNDFIYQLGDYLKVEGNLNKINNNTVFNNFNYKEYLKHNNIYYSLNVKKIFLIKENNNLIYKLKNKLLNYLNNFKSKDYLRLFLFADSSYLDNNIYNSYQINGISHLLSVGSIQFGFICMFILKLLNKLKINKFLSHLILFIILYIILLFTNYNIVFLRIYIYLIIKFLFKQLKINLNQIKIFILVIIITLFINPFIIYNKGFIYSYGISFIIILNKDIIKGDKINKLFKISIISFIYSIPFNIYFNYSINLLSIFYNIILIPVFNIIIFYLSILTFFIPLFDNILFYLFNFINNISLKLNEIDFGIISFKKLSIFMLIIYLIVFSIIIYNIFHFKKKYILILIFILFIHYNIDYIIKNNYLVFIDVNQGDSSLIYLNNNSILIDTGGLYNKDIYNKTLTMIKSFGIRKINSLIITHGDYDHMGEAINLVNNFKVEKVIFNCGEYNDLEKELIKVLDKKKIKYYSCIKELNIDKNKLYFLQTKEYDNENDNSNVIYTELNGYKFMFMGDAGIDKEKDILEKYNISEIDILKVGHHGSKTSSGKDFIDETNPKYSIISVGKNNRYGHPNKEVLNNLNNSKIYRTDQDGSIMFKIKNNKLRIETCSP